MAIINLAFEEIKANKSDFQSKFDLLNYVKRTTREMVGLNVAEPIVPVYVGEENQEEEEEDEADATERISENFTQKTDRLLDYITRTYLADGFIETEEGKRVLAKMSIANGAPAVRLQNSTKNTEVYLIIYCRTKRRSWNMDSMPFSWGTKRHLRETSNKKGKLISCESRVVVQ